MYEPATQNERDELARLRKLATLFDASIPVPGTGFSFGLDALIGLLPGGGDLVSSAVSLWIIIRGRRLGARRRTVLRMLWNLLLDFVIGAIPLAGDLFDAFWKANLRNLALIERDLHRRVTRLK